MITVTGLHDHNTSPTRFETFKEHLATYTQQQYSFRG